MSELDGNDGINEAPNDKLLKTVVNLFQISNDWKQRYQHLSLISDDHSKVELKGMVPDVTLYQIDSSKKHASQHGRCISVPAKNIMRCIEEAKFDHSIDFLADQLHLKTASWGSIKLHIYGDVEIPNVKRTQHVCHLDEKYQKFNEKIEFELLSRATLFRVLNDCEASHTRSLEVLEKITLLGINSLESLFLADQLYLKIAS